MPAPTWDQLIDLLKTLFPILVPSVVALWTVLYTGQQENRRAIMSRDIQLAEQENQRKNREMDRSWNVADQKSNARRELLSQHKVAVEEGLKAHQLFLDRYWRLANDLLDDDANEEEFYEEIAQVGNVAPSLNYHILFFNEPGLTRMYHKLKDLEFTLEYTIDEGVRQSHGVQEMEAWSALILEAQEKLANLAGLVDKAYLDAIYTSD